MDSNFTRAAWSTLERAAVEAVQRRQKAIEPRHILLGFLEGGRAAASLILQDVGVDRADPARAVDDSLPRRQDERATARPSDLPYTGRADQILSEARRLTRDDGRTRVGTADLLLALATEKGIARTILHQFDIEQERVRSTRAARADAIAAEDRGEDVEMADEEVAARPAPEPEDAAGFDPTDVPDRPESGGYATDGSPGWPVSDEKTRERDRRAGAEEDEQAAAQAAGEAPKTKVEKPEARPSRSGPSGTSLSFLSLETSAPRPLYRQIAEGIEEAAATGRIGPGARLPSIREAADALSVSSGTVARAYRELEEGEIVHTRGTRGTFVAAPEPATATGERIRELADRLRAPVITGYHMGAGPEELHRALDRAMEGILTPGEKGGGS